MKSALKSILRFSATALLAFAAASYGCLQKRIALMTFGIIINVVLLRVVERWTADDKEEALPLDAELAILIDEGYFKMLVNLIAVVLLFALLVFFTTANEYGWFQIITIVVISIVSFLLVRRARKSQSADMTLYGLLPITLWNLGMLGYVMYRIKLEGSFCDNELNSFFVSIFLIECWFVSTIYKLLRFKRNLQPTTAR